MIQHVYMTGGFNEKKEPMLVRPLKKKVSESVSFKDILNSKIEELKK